jgi:hypothetical protein
MMSRAACGRAQLPSGICALIACGHRAGRAQALLLEPVADVPDAGAAGARPVQEELGGRDLLQDELDRRLGREQPVDRARLAVRRGVRVVRVGLVAAAVDVVVAHRDRQQPEAGRIGAHLGDQTSLRHGPDQHRVLLALVRRVGLRAAVGCEEADAAAVHAHPQRARRVWVRPHLRPDHERLVAADRAGIGEVAVEVERVTVDDLRPDELDLVRVPGHPDRRAAGQSQDRQSDANGPRR